MGNYHRGGENGPKGLPPVFLMEAAPADAGPGLPFR